MERLRHGVDTWPDGDTRFPQLIASPFFVKSYLLSNKAAERVNLMLVSLERVVKRMGRSYRPRLFGDRNCENANAIVVWQRQHSRTRRHIDRVSKQIGVCIRLGAAVGGAPLRAEPGDVRTLDEAGTQSDHLAVG